MSRYMAPLIKQKIEEQGESYRERSNTIHTRCPRCSRSDKFSILKENGHCICYHGSCDFGKQWFEVWLSETSGLTVKEARKQLYGTGKGHSAKNFIPNPFAEKPQKLEEDILAPIPWPPARITAKGKEEALHIDEADSAEGLKYLESRGIPLDIARRLNIMYFPFTKRVVFPIISNGNWYGWQARSIDPNCDLRMLTSEGFKRAEMVMFADNVKMVNHVILCEGPVDAIKFYYVGGAVSTMGKEVTKKQLDFIFKQNPNIKAVYLALDKDAAEEMNKISLEVPVYWVQVPQTCVDRCKELDKKADFGECSFREAYVAFHEAKRINSMIVTYTKPIFS